MQLIARTTCSVRCTLEGTSPKCKSSMPSPVQVKDQAWVRGNAALCNAQQHGTPVRVVRAAARNGDPKQGFDYT